MNDEYIGQMAVAIFVGIPFTLAFFALISIAMELYGYYKRSKDNK